MWNYHEEKMNWTQGQEPGCEGQRKLVLPENVGAVELDVFINNVAYFNLAPEWYVDH